MSLDSKQVEERVLKMTFDNDSFEKKTKQSLTTLEKLKSSLDFRGASKGFENIASNTNILSKNINVLNSGVQSIQHEFSSLEVIGATCLVNLTNAAIKAGKNMVNALTLEPVKTGFQEYETKMGSIQTILTNTAKQGTTLNEVIDALDELNLYADKTIYNFQQMTRNVGTFTAAGLDLKTSTASIQGIANLAAASGSTSQQASTAMYQLSQALSAGTVKLQDWNSVVNAGMGGTLFQDALKETAKEMGTDADAIIEKAGSFRNSLQKGWITSDVLAKTLNKFTVKGAKEYGEAMLQSGEYTAEANKALLEQAQRMEDAATKVKTFTQLWDTLKETAQSGWGKTWEIIVGDYDKAKEFFTSVNDVISPLLDRMANARNDLLEKALGSPSKWNEIVSAFSKAGIGMESINKAFAKTFADKGVIKDTKEFDELLEKYGGDYSELVKGVKKEGLDNFEFINLARESLKEAARENANYTESSMSATEKLKTFQKVVNDVWRGDYGNQSWNKERQQALEAEGYEYERVQRLVNLVQDAKSGYALTMEDLTEEDLRSLGLTKAEIEAYRELEKQLKDTDSELNVYIDSMYKATGRELLIDSLFNIGRAIKSVVKPMAEAYQTVFAPLTGDDIYSGIEAFNKFTQSLILNEEKAKNLKNIFVTLFNVFDSVRLIVSSGLRLGFGIISKLLKSLNIEVGPLFEALANGTGELNKWMHENDIVDYILNKIGPGIEWLGDKLAWLFDKVRELPMFQNGITNGIIDLLNEIKRVAGEKFGGLFGKIFGGSASPGEAIAESIDPKTTAEKVTERLVETAGQIKTGVTDAIAGNLDSEAKTGSAGEKVKNKVTVVFVDFFKNAFSGIGEALKTAFNWLSERIDPSTIIAGGFILTLLKITEKVTSVLFMFEKPLEALAGFFKSWGKVGDSVRKYVDAKRTSLVVNNFLKVAAGLLVMSFAIRNLGKMKASELAKGVGGCMVLIMGLQALTYIIMKGIGANPAKIEGAFGLLIGMAAMVGVLSASLSSFKDMTMDQIMAAELALVGVMGLVTLFLVVIKKLYTVQNEKIDLPGLGAVIFGVSFAIKRMVDATKTAGEMDMGTVKRGLLVVSTMMAMLSLLMAASMAGHRRNFTGSGGLGVTALAAALAIAILVKMVKTAAEVTKEEFKQAIKVIGAMMLMVTAVAIISRIGKGGNAGLAILSWMGAFLMIPLVIKEINMLDLHDVDYAFSLMTSVSSMFSFMLMASKMAGKYAVRGAVLITAATMMMALLTPVIALLTMIAEKNPEALSRAVRSIAVILGMFGVLTFLSSFAISGDISSAKSVIIAAGIIVALLAGVAIALGSIQDDKVVIKGVAAVIAILLAIGFMFWAASKMTFDKAAQRGIDKGAMWSIFAFIGALAVMVGVAITAMGILNAISPNKDAGNKMLEHVSNTMMVIAAFIFAISVGTAIMMKNAPTQAMSWKGWGQLVLMAASMAALLVGIYAAIKLIDLIPSNGNVLDNVVKMGLAIAALVAIVLLAVLITRVAHKMSFAGDPKKLETITKQLLTTCALMGALLVEAGIIVYAMGNINMPSLNWTALVQVFAVMLMMCLMGAGLSVIAHKLAGTDIKDAANVLVGICIAMGFVAIEAAAVLKGINAMGVEAVDWKVIGNIIALMIGMAAVAGILTLITAKIPVPNGKDFIGTGGMFGFVGLVAAFLTQTVMPDLNGVNTEGLMEKIGGLILLIVAIAIVTSVLSGTMITLTAVSGPKLAQAWLAEGGIMAVVALVARYIASDVMPELNKVHAEGIFEKSMSLCGILLSLAIVTAIMAAIIAVPGVSTADVAMGAVIMGLIGVIGEVLGAFGALLTGGLIAIFDNAGTMDQLLNMTSKLPQLGDDIHKFIEAIDVTADDDDALNSVKNFIALLGELAGLTILKEVTDALGITDDIFESLGTIGESMAGGISAMLEAMNSASLDPDAVQKFADCVKPILGLQLMMYGSNGALQFFLGEKDLAVFGNQLGAFAKGAATLAYYLDNGVTVDGTKYKPNWVNSQSVIKSFCDCIKPITDLQKSLYGYGGKVQWIMGEKDLSLFAEQMVKSYPNYADFATSITGDASLWTADTNKVIDNFAYCLTEIAKACNAIPNEGGKLAEWIGDNSASDFADSLVDLADGMYYLNTSINHAGLSWDETKFSKFALCLTTVGEAIGKIPTNEDGWWQVLTSTLHPNIGNFSNDIVSLSNAMVDMNASLDGKASLFLDGSIVTMFKNLSGALENLPTDDQIYNLSEYALNAASNNFETNLKSLGSAIAGFVGPLSTLNNTNISSATTSLNLMTEALKNASSIDFGNLEKYGGNLTNLGETTITGFVDAFEGSYADCAKGVTSFATNMEEAYRFNGVYRMRLIGKHVVEDIVSRINEKLSDVTKAATDICNSIYNVFSDYHDHLYNIGVYLTNGFIEGINARKDAVKEAVDGITNIIGPRMENNLEEESPSKMTFRIGSYVGEGLANGMMNSLSMVQNASDIMSEESVMAINGALNNMYNSFDQETFNPTITPVLDMSEVQNGFGYINGMLDNSIIGLASRNLDVSADMSNYDVIDTLNSLGESLGTSTVNNYNVNGITYDDGSNVASAVGQLIYAANIARRS